jgi:hypothetical protein
MWVTRRWGIVFLRTMAIVRSRSRLFCHVDGHRTALVRFKYRLLSIRRILAAGSIGLFAATTAACWIHATH